MNPTSHVIGSLYIVRKEQQNKKQSYINEKQKKKRNGRTIKLSFMLIKYAVNSLFQSLRLLIHVVKKEMIIRFFFFSFS